MWQISDIKFHEFGIWKFRIADVKNFRSSEFRNSELQLWGISDTKVQEFKIQKFRIAEVQNFSSSEIYFQLQQPVLIQQYSWSLKWGQSEVSNFKLDTCGIYSILMWNHRNRFLTESRRHLYRWRFVWQVLRKAATEETLLLWSY